MDDLHATAAGLAARAVDQYARPNRAVLVRCFHLRLPAGHDDNTIPTHHDGHPIHVHPAQWGEPDCTLSIEIEVRDGDRRQRFLATTPLHTPHHQDQHTPRAMMDIASPGEHG